MLTYQTLRWSCDTVRKIVMLPLAGLAGGVRDCHGCPTPNVRLVVTGKQLATRNDPDGQFSLRVPGQLDAPVQLRLQTSQNVDRDGHW